MYFLWIGAGFLFLIGVIGLQLGYRRRRETEAILAGGVPATATVTQVYKVWGGRSIYYYYVGYQFEVMGQTYDKKESVSYSYYRHCSRGSQVEIRYLTENPVDTARIASKTADIEIQNGRMFASACALVMAVFFVIVAPILQSQSQNRNQPVQVTLTPWWPNADLAAIRAVIEPQIPAWREAASADTATHHVTAVQAGLAPSSRDPLLNLSGVDYGYCQNRGFYVIAHMAWQKSKQGYLYVTAAYSYIAGGHRLQGFPTPEYCTPDAYAPITQRRDAGEGWYFSDISTTQLTPSPIITLPPPTPTQAP